MLFAQWRKGDYPVLKIGCEWPTAGEPKPAIPDGIAFGWPGIAALIGSFPEEYIDMGDA